MSNKPYRAVVSEKYEADNGETKWYNTQVGVAFRHKNDDGFDVVIRQGISVSGRIAIYPPREDEQDGAEDAPQ